MKTCRLFAVFMVLIGCFSLYAQELPSLTSKDSVIRSSWVVGLGMNIVDDSATPFGRDFLKMKQTWNFAPYPSRISIGKFFSNGLGVEAIGSYNYYRAGKKVDGEINPSPRNYYAFDAKISYDLNFLLGDTSWFDPYLHTGAGYSSIGGLGRTTFNGGFGFNTWFSERWGFNFNTVGKWGLKQGSTKQMQHSAGVVYRFAANKVLSKKGEEKLALIQEMEKALERKQDSLAEAKRAEEELELARRLAREKEEERRLALERDNEIARATENLQRKLDSLGPVYFDFDSSDLNKDSRRTLDAIAELMREHKIHSFEINAHTDSRGTKEYNQWLSERRAMRAVTYLVEKGIETNRLISIGHGELMILNKCSDGVYCTEKEHKENRVVRIEVKNNE